MRFFFHIRPISHLLFSLLNKINSVDTDYEKTHGIVSSFNFVINFQRKNVQAKFQNEKKNEIPFHI